MLTLMSLVPPCNATENGSPSLLEIEEEGSDRRSYDLNVYDLGVSVSKADKRPSGGRHSSERDPAKR